MPKSMQTKQHSEQTNQQQNVNLSATHEENNFLNDQHLPRFQYDGKQSNPITSKITPQNITSLQRILGNRAVARLIASQSKTYPAATFAANSSVAVSTQINRAGDGANTATSSNAAPQTTVKNDKKRKASTPKAEARKKQKKDAEDAAKADVDNILQCLQNKSTGTYATWDKVKEAIYNLAVCGDFEYLLKRLIGIIYDVPTKQAQFKFPFDTHAQQAKAKYGKDQHGKEAQVRKEVGPKDFSTNDDDKILQKLRWISTIVYKHLKDKAKKPVEIQTLWDGEKLYITENAIKNNADVKTLLTGTGVGGLDDFLKNYAGKETKQDRFERHPAKLKKDLEASNPSDIIKALKAKKLETATKGQSQKAEMHAELRLVENYLASKPVAAPQGQGGLKKIYVAGLKRPCGACFVRLGEKNIEAQKKGYKIISNPHKGLLWPSESAWEGATKEDKVKGLQEIGLELFIDYIANETDDTLTNLIKHINNHTHYINKGKKGDSVWNEDTESEGEGS